ncbi:hypothetical protein, partial [Klebsiella pneumoniae]|uniref:hypothetical protein n=2 Tax=Klebsiella pneumoniae TaxID=573 RepID=UPI002E352027
QLNNRIVLAHIEDSKRHDADNSNIVQGLALDRFAILQAADQCMALTGQTESEIQTTFTFDI